MSCFKNRKSLLACNRTASLISICHNHSESSLPQPMLSHRFTITISLAAETNDRLQPFLDLLKQPQAICVFRIIPLTLDNASAKILRRRDPVLLIEVKNVCEDDTSDLRILHDDIVPGTVFFNSNIQVLEGGRSVLFSKGGPGKICRQQRILYEVPATDNIILRSVQLKKKQIVFLKRFKRLTPRLPEINLIRLTLLQELKPIIIRYAHIDLHFNSSPSHLDHNRTIVSISFIISLVKRIQ